ncbi:amino acid ABC transporter substrate-binding protein [Aquibacillus koreensis]|uniref:Amino acid ABC transporter substrate-binding protein n=1 Tax=Aquibacillus koreensis TaxID=279446 RepID=A0A9X4AJR3_9BACI|nr:amino acid ABC transporter substrate-binding protein [Aquibacillus koreensis]MCT2534255.1 amino acid ABC transporter substrate-binding protein [Aquibacillus koreensis]MDC3420700.1 amino acid ABC transporter substrate-binding protein [Aquibacillus koreensis]
MAKRKHAFSLLLASIFLSFSLLLVACSDDGSSDETASSDDTEDTASSAEEGDSTLDTVKERGNLVLGGNNQLPGFGYVNEDGDYEGFDIDFGRAIAAAIFDDPSAIEVRPLSADERFTALQTGEVDVLIRNTTWTTTRDTDLGTHFAPTTFYDGQGLMVRKDSGITSVEDLEGATIGVETGTTTELNLADQFRKLGIEYEQQVFDDSDALVAAYEQGSVDAWTTDKSGLVSRQATLSDPEAHVILDETLSKEPLGPTVRQGDDQWFNIVKWITFATMEAEELGITSENVDDFLDSDNPVVRRLLGDEGELGAMLGLPNDFAYRVIKHVGNYGEIYNRHLGPDTVFGLERGVNSLWTEGGLLYSPPFR